MGLSMRFERFQSVKGTMQTKVHLLIEPGETQQEVPQRLTQEYIEVTRRHNFMRCIRSRLKHCRESAGRELSCPSVAT